MNLLESCDAQVRALSDWFDRLADVHKVLPRLDVAANDDYLEQQA